MRRRSKAVVLVEELRELVEVPEVELGAGVGALKGADLGGHVLVRRVAATLNADSLVRWKTPAESRKPSPGRRITRRGLMPNASHTRFEHQAAARICSSVAVVLLLEADVWRLGHGRVPTVL
jgi:hypothetical protein